MARQRQPIENTILCATRFWSLGWREKDNSIPTLRAGVRHVVREQGFKTKDIYKAERRLVREGLLEMEPDTGSIRLTNEGNQVDCRGTDLSPWTDPDYEGSALAGKNSKMNKKKKKKEGERAWWVTTLKWTAIGIVAWESYLALSARRNKRRDVFNAAVHAANTSGRKLLVIGDPERALVNKLIGRDYSCGTLCLDPQGCLTCPEGSQETGPTEGMLRSLGAGEWVVYVSPGQLEQADDIHGLMSELNRVSGGDIFVAPLEPWSLAGFWPAHKRRILESPPDFPHVEVRPLPWAPDLRTKNRERIRFSTKAVAPDATARAG